MVYSQNELIKQSSKDKMLDRLATTKDDANQSGSELVKLPDCLKNTNWAPTIKSFAVDSTIKFTQSRFILNFTSIASSDFTVQSVYLDSTDAVGDISESNLSHGMYEVDFSTGYAKNITIIFALNDDLKSGIVDIRYSNKMSLIFHIKKFI
ncbi:MAG: hypothetical protein KAH18_08525 [Psychromonas sp.]|nr:hypothetical protein [Psychromonas sp.]